MDLDDIKKLRSLTDFPALVAYLRDELDWPIEVEDADEVAFDYDAAELGIDPKHAVKIESIKQVRPLADNQPWGIFYIEFESKRLPVVVLRRILRSLVPKRRGDPDRPVWGMDDLLFISAFGDKASDQREIAFAHFHQETGDLPTLRVLGWDGADTPLKLDHVAATLKARLCWPSDPGDADAWRQQWTPAFRHRVGHVIRTADALAERLALLARGIRDAATTLMDHESERGPLRRLHKAFQTALIHDLSETDFADTYAQTITYGLLTAAISRTEMSKGRYGTALVAGNVTDMVPITNPFLREMLQTFIQAGGRRGGIDFDELGIQDVVELLRGDETDLPAVLRDFGNRTRGEDPVMHFYEHFLAAYDKRLKVQRGIFYTPQPVVSYIVRSVHELLQTEFGLEDGLASTVTWGDMAARHPSLRIPDGADPQSPFVVVLDPATGTATFLVEVIDVVHRTLTAKWTRQGLNEAQRRAAWNECVPRHLLPRLYGYELMMAPYAIAHMKIGLKLYETGYRFGSDERVRVYLTNTLEPASDSDAQLAFAEWAPALAHEAQAVNDIKRRQRFTVVIGNPPYANFGQLNRIPFILGLLEDYKCGLNEKKLNLDDDFIKFLRLAQHVIESAGCGLLGFITNNTYLDGITHRQMRNSIRAAMSTVRILDLHGSAAKKEKCPDGSKDENVFDIQQGVGISLWTRRGNTRPAEVQHADLWGLRKAKYVYLRQQTGESTQFCMLSPTAPYQFFVPKDFELTGEYETGVSLTEMFNVNANGVKTDRDALFFGENRQEVAGRMRTFFSSAGIAEPFRSQFRVEDSSSYPLLKRRMASRFDGRYIRRCLYRPFDVRWLYYSVGITSRPAWDVMHHMLPEHSLGLLAMRQYEYDVPDYCYFLATRILTECRIFVSNRGIANCFPLYLAPERDTLQGEMFGTFSRRTNLRPTFLKALARTLGLRCTGDDGLPEGLTPEDIFHYMYAVFHSPSYRSRYAEFLKIEFPRLPLTSDLDLFRWLCTLGADLVALHLLEGDYPAASWNQTGGAPPLQHPITTFVEGINGTTMGAFGKSTCYQDGKVYLDTSQLPRSSYFDGVPEDVWNFHIGGYQVCYKWLYDRRGKKGVPGRTLTAEDIAHYQRIVVALKETIRLMEEIDEVIEDYGGWPIG